MLTPDEELHNMVEEIFFIENAGYCENKESSMDEKSEILIEKTTKRIGKMWQTGLLWQNENIKLPGNKFSAMKRLKQTERKMDGDKNFCESYGSKIDEYSKKGYASKSHGEKMKNGLWRWVNTKQNIADEATEWNKPEDIQNWLTGRFFLRKPEEQRPKENFGNEVCSFEKRKFVVVVTEQSSC
ncbi:hypothetical protein JTB14_010091 [Gonioctena quinquepunctata]|nr:hypothetical protein JTB14_010091 [Gonioctena quinquepunctata]